MSRTKGHIKSIRENPPRRKKLSPYVTDKHKGEGKFTVDITYGNPHGARGGGMKTGVSRLNKLVTRNANRSRKKAYRQQLKKEIKEELYGRKD